MTTFDSFFTVFTTLLAVVAVVVMAFLTSRLVSRRFGSLNGGRYLRVVDRLVVGQGQQILLLETGGRILCLGISGQTMATLCQLEPGQLTDISRQPPAGDFTGAFLAALKKKLPGYGAQDEGEGDHK